MPQELVCGFYLDRRTQIPICQIHRQPLERLENPLEIFSVPGPEDTTIWKCLASGQTFLVNSNFQETH